MALAAASRVATCTTAARTFSLLLRPLSYPGILSYPRHTRPNALSVAKIMGSTFSSSSDTGGERTDVDPALATRAREDPGTMSDAEWKKVLTNAQYEVTRGQGTEPAFTGHLWDNKKNGMYHCVCCHSPLFSSSTKFESGSGWPSFTSASDSRTVTERSDFTLGMARTEANCSKCRAHLGHVFDDGPQPTGRRFCINSASLRFKEKEGKKK